MESKSHQPITDTANQPSVVSIRVDYEDGDYDTIKFIQRDRLLLYSLTRKRADSMSPLGAYTSGAIAAILFNTAITAKRMEHLSQDKKLAGLLRYWMNESQAGKQKSEKK
jgi:hypothetical protein